MLLSEDEQVSQAYKNGPLGSVPIDWEKTPFSELFVSFIEYTNDLDRFPLYSLTIEDGVTAKTECYERSHLVKKKNLYKVVRPNDFVYNPMNVRFGAIARYKGSSPVAVSGYYDVFSSVHESDSVFMENFLTFAPIISYYNKVSTGSLIEKQRVHFSKFLKFAFPLPSLQERKKIAAILSTQDKVIELKEKLLALKQQQKKYLMQQLLMPKNKEKSFKAIHLSDISCLINKHIDGQKYNYVSTENISPNLSGKVLFDESNIEISGVGFNAGDILVGNIRPYLKKVWRANKDGLCSTDVLVFKPIGISSEFLYYLIANDNFFFNVMTTAKGSKMPRGDKKAIMSAKMLIPESRIEQNFIVEILSTADHEINLLQESIEAEKQKKKALMQLLLTGKVRVK